MKLEGNRSWGAQAEGAQGKKLPPRSWLCSHMCEICSLYINKLKYVKIPFKVTFLVC